MIFCHLLLLLASASLLVGTSKADWWGDFLDGAKTKVSDGVDFIKNEAVPSIAEKFDQAKEAIVPAVSEKFDQAKTAVVESDAHTKVRSWFEDSAIPTMKEKYADVKSSMRDGLSSVAKQLDD